MNILTLYALPKSTKRDLLAAHPDWQIIERDQYQPAMGATIDVILGWNAAAQTLLSQPNQVRFVQAMSAGVDYLPLASLQAQHIQLANTAGIHAEPIAEYVLGGILTMARGFFPPVTSWDAQARFKQMWTLRHKQAVVFGTGHIGQAVARHLGEFGATVTGVNHSGRTVAAFAQTLTQASAAPALKQADIIVNTMPLTPETNHYFDAAFFAQLQAKPVFVNVGRGASVATEALLQALTSHQLGSAVLDVFEDEPLPADHPLWRRADVLITPHISGQTEQLRRQVADIFVPNLEALAATGQIATHIVDLTLGY